MTEFYKDKFNTFLEARLNKLKEEVSSLETDISDMKNGSKESESLIIKYKEKPSFINEAIEYSHSEILDIVSGSEWTEEIEI